MLRFWKKILMFQIGKKASRRFARVIGVRGPIANLLGVIGGIKSMRRYA